MEGGAILRAAALLVVVLAIAAPPAIAQSSFTTYEHASGFRLPIPVGWDVREDEMIEGVTIELVLYGPYGEGFQTNILVETDRDPTVRETSLYMANTYQATVDDIRADDPTAVVADGPDYRPIGNHSGFLFEVRYGSDNVIQRMAFTVSDPHDRYWFLILSTTPGFYDGFAPMFDEMVDGFEVTAARVGGLDPALLGILAGLAAAAVVAVVLAVVVVRRRERPAPPVWYGPPMPPASVAPMPASPTEGPKFCPACGAPVTAGARFCIRCGADLRHGPPPGPPPGAG